MEVKDMDVDKNFKNNQNLHDYQKATIANFKKAFKNMIAASESAYVKSDNKFVKNRNRMYDKEEILRIVEEGDPIERAALSEFFFATNGVYKRIILHYATFLTYSWILVPYTKNKYGKSNMKDRKIQAAYYDASNFCSSFQIENKCSVFSRDVFVKGAYYGLIHDNGEKVVIQKLPFEYCRSRFRNIDDIDIVEFNMTFFDTIKDEKLRQEILSTYPLIVQQGYKKYKFHSGEKWIFLPAEMGIYFSYFDERPFFLDLIPLLDDLNDYLDLDKKRNLQALQKILVQQVPIDGMKLVFEPEEAEEMHEGSIEMLQYNDDIDVITTYCDVNLLDMSSEDDEKTDFREVQDLIYSSAGLSKELFFATTEAGLQYSINNDLAMMMLLAQRYAHFFTTLLNYKFENKKVKFKLLILPISYYNSSEYSSRAKDAAAFGYSFLTPVLAAGLDQTSLTALKVLENELLELDETLKPLQSAYTQSGKNNQTQQTEKDTDNNQDNQKDDETKDQSKENEDEKESKNKKESEK